MRIVRLSRHAVRALGAGVVLSLGLVDFVSAAAAATQAEITQIVAEEAAKNGRVPLPLALAVAKVESDLRDDAVSTSGARGVMQIMPATAMGEFGVPGSALGEPRLNVRLGIAYLERLHNRYGGDWQLALSHYNGGALPAAAGHYVAHDYTRQYVADVMKWANAYANDATLMALAKPDGTPAVQLASVETKPALPAATTRAVTADDGYPSLGELRERFRASLDRRREASAASSETVVTGDGAAAPAARPGRFSYAPYGG